MPILENLIIVSVLATGVLIGGVLLFAWRRGGNDE